MGEVCKFCRKEHEGLFDMLRQLVDGLIEEMKDVSMRANLELAQASASSMDETVAKMVGGEKVIEEMNKAHRWVASGQCQLPFNAMRAIVMDTPMELRNIKAQLLLDELCKLELLERTKVE